MVRTHTRLDAEGRCDAQPGARRHRPKQFELWEHTVSQVIVEATTTLTLAALLTAAGLRQPATEVLIQNIRTRQSRYERGISDVGVDLCGLYALMAEQSLDVADIDAPFN